VWAGQRCGAGRCRLGSGPEAGLIHPQRVEQVVTGETRQRLTGRPLDDCGQADVSGAGIDVPGARRALQGRKPGQRVEHALAGVVGAAGLGHNRLDPGIQR
jgi:hypothetical protein